MKKQVPHTAVFKHRSHVDDTIFSAQDGKRAQRDKSRRIPQSEKQCKGFQNGQCKYAP
jgi:hypothetical protein